MSAPLMPAALTRSSSSPDPGSGSGWSSTESSPSRTVTAFTDRMFPRSAEKGVRVTLLTVSQVPDHLYVSGALKPGKASSAPLRSHEDPQPIRATDVAGKPDRPRAGRPDALGRVAGRRH